MWFTAPPGGSPQAETSTRRWGASISARRPFSSRHPQQGKVGFPMKIVITKVMSEHENAQVEITAKDAADLAKRYSEVLPILDARLLDLGERVIEADTWTRSLPG